MVCVSCSWMCRPRVSLCGDKQQMWLTLCVLLILFHFGRVSDNKLQCNSSSTRRPEQGNFHKQRSLLVHNAVANIYFKFNIFESFPVLNYHWRLNKYKHRSVFRYCLTPDGIKCYYLFYCCVVLLIWARTNVIEYRVGYVHCNAN